MHSRDKYITPYYENSVKTCLDPIYQQITLTARGKLVTQGLQGLFVPSVKRGPEKLFGTRVLGLAGGIRSGKSSRAVPTYIGALHAKRVNYVSEIWRDQNRN